MLSINIEKIDGKHFFDHNVEFLTRAQVELNQALNYEN